MFAQLLPTLVVLAAASPFPPDDPKQQPWDAAQLQAVLDRAKETQSDAVVIVRDGKLAAEWYAGGQDKKIEAMSATKSVVALAIGRLLFTGRLKSLDEPVHTFFPEWKQGKKQTITVRHLMNHTSGLQNVPNTTVEIYPSKDFVKLALAAELSDDPGTKFAYNNKAVNLLAGIVERASGKKLDDYLRGDLFKALGITDFTWTRDAAGNPHAMSGLQIRALDFAKLGQLVLDGGVWKGKRLLSEQWVKELLAPSQELAPTCGLLWWRSMDVTMSTDDAFFDRMKQAGVDPQIIAKAEPLRGKSFHAEGELVAELRALFGDTWQKTWVEGVVQKGVRSTRTYGPVRGYDANGYLGQYLVIVPSTRVVAVRLFEPDTEDFEPSDGKTDFVDFIDRITALGAPAATASEGPEAR